MVTIQYDAQMVFSLYRLLASGEKENSALAHSICKKAYRYELNVAIFDIKEERRAAKKAMAQAILKAVNPYACRQYIAAFAAILPKHLAGSSIYEVPDDPQVGDVINDCIDVFLHFNGGISLFRYLRNHIGAHLSKAKNELGVAKHLEQLLMGEFSPDIKARFLEAMRDNLAQLCESREPQNLFLHRCLAAATAAVAKNKSK